MLYFIPLPHVIVLTMKTIFRIPILQRTFFVLEKSKSKEREVNLGSLYGSSWARGIWPLIGIFLIWIDECKVLGLGSFRVLGSFAWVMFSRRINATTAILIIVTFIRFTAVSTCPVRCHPGISQYWLPSSERTPLLQAWMSYNCLYFSLMF